MNPKKSFFMVLVCLASLLFASEIAWASGGAQVKEEVYNFRLATSQADIPAENAVVQKLEELLGVDITMIVLPHGDDATAKLHMLLAAKDFPDIIPHTGDSKLISDGMASFTFDELKTYMPRYVKKMNEMGGQAVVKMLWDSHWVDPEKTKMKTISSASEDSTIPYGGAWRWDKLEEVGVTSVPTTIEEFGDALAKVKARWPDKFPINPRGKYQWQCFTSIFGAYGVTTNWEFHDGKLIKGTLTENAKLAYAVLQDWFSKGYINPEFVTNNDAWADFKRGDAVWIDWPGWWYLSEKNTSSSVLAEMKKINPNAKGVMSPLLKSELYPEVQPTWPVWFPISLGPSGIGFGSHLEKDRDKLHKAMEIIERLTFEDEVALVAAFGIEGKHWTRNADGKSVTVAEGYPLYSTEAIAEGIHGQVYSPISGLSVATRYTFSEGYWTAKAEYKNIVGWTADGWVNRFSIPLVTGPLKDKNGEQLTFPNLDKLESQAFVWLVSGEKPISYFDEFVAKWMKDGGEQLVEAANRDYVKMWKDAGVLK